MFASDQRNRCIIEAAALTEEVGGSKREKGRRKRSFKLLNKLAPPPGWSAQDMRAVAIVARYHRGAIAPLSHGMFTGVPARSRIQIVRLAGVLRLANALAGGQPSETQLAVSRNDGVIAITAQGLEVGIGPLGERLARANIYWKQRAGYRSNCKASPPRTLDR